MNVRLLPGLLVLGALLCALPARAEVPTQMAVQGVLRGPSGLQSGVVGITFRVYARDGTQLWQERRDVVVENGLFNVALGGTTALDPAFFLDGGASTVGVTVDGEAEMTPRIRLQATPYAFASVHAEHAALADIASSADTLSGFTLADLQERITASAPLSLSGTQLRLATCADGQFLRSQGGAWTCSTETGQSFVVGAGLSFQQGILSIPTGGVVSSHVLDGTLAGMDLAQGTVTSRELAGNVALLDGVGNGNGNFTRRVNFTASGVALAATAVGASINAPRFVVAAANNTAVTVQAAAANAAQTLTLPALPGTARDMLLTDGAGNLSFGRRASVNLNAAAFTVGAVNATVTGLSTVALNGTYLVMFSGTYVSTTSTTDVTFTLFKGEAEVAEARRTLTVVAAQRRSVATQAITTLANESVSIRAFQAAGAGATDIQLVNGTLTLLEL